MSAGPRPDPTGGTPTAGDADSGLLGRAREQQSIEAVLDAARRGSSAVLVLDGEAGMGKTMLLESARASAAAEMSVASIAGVQSEAAFGFGALHRLLVPFMDRIDGLPERQRDAIGTAFGVRAGPPPDRFMVGLAALTVLADAAADEPLLLVIDDAQWLDGESLDALALIGRRLFAEGIAMLFGRRAAPGAPVIEGLPVLSIAGLPDAAALGLLESVATSPIAPSVAHRIITETEGCPLALREVARMLRPEQLMGDDPLLEPLPIGGRLERHFLVQVRTLKRPGFRDCSGYWVTGSGAGVA